jgi:hypothetical protein
MNIMTVVEYWYISKVNQIYRNGTKLQADLFALNTLMMSYLPFLKIRKKKLFSKNLYGKWLILFTFYREIYMKI